MRPLTKRHLERLKKQGFQKGIIPWNKEKTQFDNETLKRIANSKRGKHHAPQSEFKKGHKAFPVYKENNWNWKGGVSSDNYKLRRSTKFLNWRKQIFERDDFTCQVCGIRGGKLHPHHIKPFALFPELRFELSNGQTMCVNCHEKTDTFLNNKIRTLEECDL